MASGASFGVVEVKDRKIWLKPQACWNTRGSMANLVDGMRAQTFHPVRWDQRAYLVDVKELREFHRVTAGDPERPTILLRQHLVRQDDLIIGESAETRLIFD